MADHGEIRVAGAWKTADEFHGRVSGAWEECDECWIRVSGAWKQFHSSGPTPCATIDSRGAEAYTEKGCNSAGKCRMCVAWALGCTPIAGQVMDIYRSLGGGSYVLVGDAVSPTANDLCSVTGTWDGDWSDDTNCSTAFRRYRVELMDTDETTTLASSLTGNTDCSEI